MAKAARSNSKFDQAKKQRSKKKVTGRGTKQSARGLQMSPAKQKRSPKMKNQPAFHDWPKSVEPIHAMISMHKAAKRAHDEALDIPETEKNRKKRDKAVTQACEAHASADAAFANTMAESLEGAIAALGYFLSTESVMAEGLEDFQLDFIKTLHRSLQRMDQTTKGIPLLKVRHPDAWPPAERFGEYGSMVSVARLMLHESDKGLEDLVRSMPRADGQDLWSVIAETLDDLAEAGRPVRFAAETIATVWGRLFSIVAAMDAKERGIMPVAA